MSPVSDFGHRGRRLVQRGTFSLRSLSASLWRIVSGLHSESPLLYDRLKASIIAGARLATSSSGISCSDAWLYKPVIQTRLTASQRESERLRRETVHLLTSRR